MSTFYLVRHAHAEWTPDENRPLSGRGRADAEQVADVLGGVPITAVYASPARRVRETVAPLAARLGLPIQIVPDLRERALCHGAVDDFFRATMPDIYALRVSVDGKTSAHRLWGQGTRWGQ